VWGKDWGKDKELEITGFLKIFDISDEIYENGCRRLSVDLDGTCSVVRCVFVCFLQGEALVWYRTVRSECGDPKSGTGMHRNDSHSEST
jgi:hypothetical protein